MSIRVLYVAEIVGKAGIWCIKQALSDLRNTEKPDLVMANGNGTTGGAGLGRQHAGYLRKLGIELITGGDSIFFKKDLVEGMDSVPYVIRPVNFPPQSPGRGWRFVHIGKERVAVVSMLGQAGFSRVHADNPFVALRPLADRLRQETPYIIVDFHASATAEKQAFFRHADGYVSAVIGSHGRVQTADAGIFPDGCGVITDAGRTGSLDSVGGVDPDVQIKEYLSRMPDWSRDAWARPTIQGVILDLEPNGKTSAIRSFSIPCGEPPQQEGA